MADRHEGRSGYLVLGVLLAVLISPVGLVVALWQAYRDPDWRSWWLVIAVVAALLCIPSILLITGG